MSDKTQSGAVEVCPICDIEGCRHIRERATPASAPAMDAKPVADFEAAFKLIYEAYACPADRFEQDTNYIAYLRSRLTKAFSLMQGLVERLTISEDVSRASIYTLKRTYNQLFEAMQGEQEARRKAEAERDGLRNINDKLEAAYANAETIELKLAAERDAALARVKELEAQKDRATFPILKGDGARIDYQLVSDHGGQAQSNHYQSVQRLAERGGLSWAELYAVLHDRKFEKMDPNEAMIACRALEARYLAAFTPPPDADLDALVNALQSGEQADMDGCMVRVSRQACEEAAAAITALRARPVGEWNAAIEAAAKQCDDKVWVDPIDEAERMRNRALMSASERIRALRRAALEGGDA